MVFGHETTRIALNAEMPVVDVSPVRFPTSTKQLDGVLSNLSQVVVFERELQLDPIDN